MDAPRLHHLLRRVLFAEGRDRLGVAWRPMNACTVSVARRESVATLDRIIGPKS
ncbi:MAG TPA: hypothetical protein VFV32_09465 [Acidimicrobiales bacterium]|nr:hypothetical protein [Acidimicrobiales bacterium]